MMVDRQELPGLISDSSTEETYAASTLGSEQPVDLGERKVLGVCWNLSSDQLLVSLEEIVSDASSLQPPTKRAIVSLIGRIYDPLGLFHLS